MPQPATARRNLRPGLILLLACIALLGCMVTLPGCTQPVIPSPYPTATTPAPVVTTGVPLPMPVTTAKGGPATPSTYLTYTSTQYGFSISYPAGWSVEENPAAGTVVFRAPAESRDDLYRENLAVTVKDLSANPMSLDQYHSAQLAKAQGITGFNKIIDTPYRLSGFNGYEIAYKGDTGMLMEWVDYFTIKVETAYDLTFTAQESHYANYVVPMDYMIKSFTFTG